MVAIIYWLFSKTRLFKHKSNAELIHNKKTKEKNMNRE